MSYYVYILTNKRHTVFYTGVTNNLERRVREHKARDTPGFTKKYNCTILLYFEEYGIIHDAIAREKVLKKYRRDWKFQLIAKENPLFEDLAKDW